MFGMGRTEPAVPKREIRLASARIGNKVSNQQKQLMCQIKEGRIILEKGWERRRFPIRDPTIVSGVGQTGGGDGGS
jgi:hypothetical protein